MSQPKSVIKVGASQKFQYRGTAIPNTIDISRVGNGPDSQCRMQAASDSWSLYVTVPAAGVSMNVNWPAGVGIVHNDAGSEIEVTGFALYPIE